MEELIKYFTTNITGDKVWIAFLFLAVYYTLKKEPFKIFAHFSDRKEKEHDLARVLLDSQKLGKDANEFLREHLERHAFRKYYEINADAEMREALIKFHKKYQRKIGWHDIRRAYSNISLTGTKISAKLEWHEHIMRWIVTTLCYLVGAYAIFVMIYAGFNIDSSNSLTFLGLTLLALLLLVTAVVFSSLNWPYHSTRKIINISTE
ncbi:hypothetical protein ACSVIJ_06070 [Pseudomonas sp. NCHU5208]|uniref:hypothetical protein n=1 Tax=unclassified Pseudomonas TaxID=196821 RepID=UPI003F95ACDB